MSLQVGDKVNHKKDNDYQNGIVVQISKSGKRVAVKWPVTRRVPFGHEAYYPIESLVKVEGDGE